MTAVDYGFGHGVDPENRVGSHRDTILDVLPSVSLEVDNTPIADDHRHGSSQFFLIESFADLLFNRPQLGSIHAAFLR